MSTFTTACQFERPQQPLAVLLTLVSNYMTNLPQIIHTIILGDLLSGSSPSLLLQQMSCREFSQLIQVPNHRFWITAGPHLLHWCY